MGFVQPWLLGWLAAASIPVLIHLWNRHRSRQIPWAAMEFLLAALQTSRQRLLFEQWLLLILRVLILVMVALAAAQPFVGKGAISPGPLTPVYRVVLVDSSRSMQASVGGRTAFEKARDQLVQLFRSANLNDLWSLGVVSSTVRWVIAEPIAFSTGMISPPADFEPTDGPANWLGALSEVSALLEKREQAGDRQLAEEVWIMTDLQASNWRPTDAAVQRQLWDRLRKLADRAVIRIVDVGPTDKANLCVEQIRVEPALLVAGDTAELAAEIAGFASGPVRSVEVALLVDGETVAKQTLTVSQDKGTSFRFPYRFYSPGDHVVEFRLLNNDDALPVDDALRIVVGVRPSLRVLCVDGQPGAGPLGGPSGYLTMALDPGMTTGTPTAVRAERRPATGLAELDPASFDVIFLCDVAELSPAEAETLERFVRGGGGLVVFLGSAVRASALNQLVDQPGQQAALMPVRLVRLIDDDPQYRLDPLGYEHPLLAAFRGFERAGLINVPVEKYWALEPLAAGGARVAVSLGNGKPLIVEKPLGLGRVVVVACPPDPAWTLLPKWPSFVPLVHEILRFATQGKSPQKNVPLGQCLRLLLPPEKVGNQFWVRTPTGHEESASLEDQGDWLSVVYCPPERTGIYTLGDQEGTEILWGLLPPKEESDLRSLPSEEFGQILGQSGLLQVVSEVGTTRPAFHTHPQATRTLTVELLWIVGGLLLMESVLACLLGQRGS